MTGHEPGRAGEPVGAASVRDRARGTAPTAPCTAAPAAAALGAYLQDEATDFLRSLRMHRESAGTAAAAADAVRILRRSARRIGGALQTYGSLVDPGWSDQLRTELSWLSGTLAREYAYATRLDRLLAALHRLATDGGAAAVDVVPAPKGAAGEPGNGLPVGAARAGALLERRLTLARTRAHSAALRALGSSRFHAVVDTVAVLASEAPLAPDAGGRTAEQVLVPLAEQAHQRLTEAVDALPLARTEHPYHAEALARSLTPEVEADTAWHEVRLLLRLHRYAQEVLVRAGAAEDHGGEPDGPAGAGRALDRHRDAAEAASAAAAAGRTPRIAPGTAYALGVLHADQRHEVEAARYAFARQWVSAATGAERGRAR